MMKLAVFLSGAIATGMSLPATAAPVDSYLVSFQDNDYRKVEFHQGRPASFIFSSINLDSDSAVGRQSSSGIVAVKSGFPAPRVEPDAAPAALIALSGGDLDLGCPYLGVCSSGIVRTDSAQSYGIRSTVDSSVTFVDGYAAANKKESIISAPFVGDGQALDDASVGSDSLVPFMEPERLALFGAALLGIALLLRKRKRT